MGFKKKRKMILCAEVEKGVEMPERSFYGRFRHYLVFGEKRVVFVVFTAICNYLFLHYYKACLL